MVCDPTFYDALALEVVINKFHVVSACIPRFHRGRVSGVSNRLSFVDKALSKLALGIPGLFQQLWGLCIVTNHEPYGHQIFSFAATAIVSGKFISYTVLSHRASWLCPWKDPLKAPGFSSGSLEGGRSIRIKSTMSSSGGTKIDILSHFQTASIKLNWKSLRRELSSSLVEKRRVRK